MVLLPLVLWTGHARHSSHQPAQGRAGLGCPAPGPRGLLSPPALLPSPHAKLPANPTVRGVTSMLATSSARDPDCSPQPAPTQCSCFSGCRPLVILWGMSAGVSWLLPLGQRVCMFRRKPKGIMGRKGSLSPPQAFLRCWKCPYLGWESSPFLPHHT